jgi:hypothetical protein
MRDKFEAILKFFFVIELTYGVLADFFFYKSGIYAYYLSLVNIIIDFF